MSEEYEPPVSQLLSLGEEPARFPERQDYLALGLTRDDVPELTRLATDRALYLNGPDRPEIWAPIHAWRALGHLKAEGAAPALAEVLAWDNEHDDWVMEELPPVFGMLGPAAIPHAAGILTAPHESFWPRTAASNALVEIAKQHPDARDECVALIAGVLDGSDDPELNGFLVADLLDLQAVEAADTMREAYRTGRVDLSIAGDFQDVEMDLGLRTRRIASRGFHLLDGPPAPIPSAWTRAGRNDPCPCGSGIKYKKCCLQKQQHAA